MSYGTNYGTSYANSPYTKSCYGSEVLIIIFGSIIVFLLIVVLICVCWICCRRDTRRDGVIIRPIDHMQAGTVLCMTNDHLQCNRSIHLHQVHSQHQLTCAHACESQQCTATAPSSSQIVLPEYHNKAPQSTSLAVE